MSLAAEPRHRHVRIRGQCAVAVMTRRVRLHGPYHQWTRKKNSRTATRVLTDDQLADYGPWFGNYRRLRELIAGLEALSLNIAEADPRWNR
jgi:hypothetical protein